MLDYATGATAVMLDLMRWELGRQFARHGAGMDPIPAGVDWRLKAPVAWPSYECVAPGIVSVTDGAGTVREVSCFEILSRLMALHNLAGPVRVGAAFALNLSRHRDKVGDRRMLPRPRNEPHRLQVEDTVVLGERAAYPNKGKVRGISITDAAGQTRSAFAVDRRGMTEGQAFVEVGTNLGPMMVDLHAIPMRASGPVPSRESVPAMKRLQGQADRIYRNHVKAIRAGMGWDKTVFALCALRTALRRCMEEISHGQQTPVSREVAFMRLHRRDLRELKAWLEAPYERIVRKGALMTEIDHEIGALSGAIKRLNQ